MKNRAIINTGWLEDNYHQLVISYINELKLEYELYDGEMITYLHGGEMIVYGSDNLIRLIKRFFFKNARDFAKFAIPVVPRFISYKWKRMYLYLNRKYNGTWTVEERLDKLNSCIKRIRESQEYERKYGNYEKAVRIED